MYMSHAVREFLWIGALLCAAVPNLNAQAAQVNPPPASQKRCAGPEYHQVDFLLGSWEVSSNGKKSADANFERVSQSDCGIVEVWKSTNGGGGNGLFAYSPVGHGWQYFWVPSSGQPTWLHDGKPTGTADQVQFTLTRTIADGTSHESHWTITKSADGHIHEVSVNLQTGATEYDLLWTKKQ